MGIIRWFTARQIPFWYVLIAICCTPILMLSCAMIDEWLFGRHTTFSRIVGRSVTMRSATTLPGSDIPLTAFTFTDPMLANKMAAAIQPGGTVIHYFDEDGTSHRETITPDIGSRPYWWLSDDIIYRYIHDHNGDSSDAVAQISTQFGIPLNAEVDATMIRIRIANKSDLTIDTVSFQTGHSGNGEAFFTDMPPDKVTSYQTVTEAYQSNTLQIKTADSEQPITLTASQLEQEQLKPGNYTYVLTAVDEKLAKKLIIDGLSYRADVENHR